MQLELERFLTTEYQNGLNNILGKIDGLISCKYHYNICILFSIRCIQCMCVLTTYVLCQLGKCLFWLSKIVETQ